MLRKLILTCLMTLTLAVPAVVPSTAAAHDPSPRPAHVLYEVLYRHDHHHPWRVYGVYHHRHEADHVAHDLRHQGYEAHVHVR